MRTGSHLIAGQAALDDDATLDLAPTIGPLARTSTEKPLGWPGKRLFDVLLASVLIVLAIPMGVLIALAVKLTSRGPVLFRQKRIGFGGHEFSILKFRTMQADAETRLFGDKSLLEVYLAGDCKIPAELDPRVTLIGRFLRRSSLDELPQLVNVLAGSMSLVGPRPVRQDELVNYGERESAYLLARPGITGLWQVSGRNHVKFPERASLDESYSKTSSLAVDLFILCRTLAAVISARGAY